MRRFIRRTVSGGSHTRQFQEKAPARSSAKHCTQTQVGWLVGAGTLCPWAVVWDKYTVSRCTTKRLGLDPEIFCAGICDWFDTPPASISAGGWFFFNIFFIFLRGLAPPFFPRFGSTAPLSFPRNCHHFGLLDTKRKCQLSQGSRGSRSPSS